MKITLVNHEGGIVNVDNRTVIVQGDLNIKRDEMQDAEAEEIFEPCELMFFDSVMFGTEKGQKGLTELLRKAAGLIDVNQGSSWFCLYAGYRYYKKQLGTKREYVKFFSDIETLLPDVLKNIVATEKGDKRYHSYTQAISLEVGNWYIDDGKLPPLNDLAAYINRYGGAPEQFRSMVQTVKEIYKMFITLDANLKAD